MTFFTYFLAYSQLSTFYSTLFVSDRKYTRRARIHFARDDFPFRTMKRDEAFEAHKASILKASHMAPSIDRLPSACGEVYHGTRQKIRCSRVMECSPSHHGKAVPPSHTWTSINRILLSGGMTDSPTNAF